MKIKLKTHKHINPKLYYQFTLIDVAFVNSYQVWSINITLFNVLFQLLHEKKK